MWEVGKREICKNKEVKCQNVIMVISGSLTLCVYELLKGESGKCTGGSKMPYFTLLNTRNITFPSAGVAAFCLDLRSCERM